MDVTQDELVALIDHTNLYPDAGEEDIERLCAEADEYDIGAVCIYPADIETAEDYREAHGADYDICTVVGFHHGRATSETKAAEAERAVDMGADEVDMVINQGYVKDGHYDAVVDDVSAVRDAVPDATLKVITENCNLSDDEKVLAYQAAIEGGADFLKTSTGFGDYGAREEDVALMADTIRELDADVGIKAAGGIGSAGDATAMLAASGFDPDPARFRIGASSGVEIVTSLGEH